jgi:hypothetical protein
MVGEFHITDVLPWGRNATEYRAMFDLGNVPMDAHILDVGGGPASFNVEDTSKGRKITSIDPIYQFSQKAIRNRIVETRSVMMEGVHKAKARFVWNYFASPEELETTRLTAMEMFLADFQEGTIQKRYIAGSLPQLPFEDNCFDLVLCSHLLFMYSTILDESFHVSSVKEMLRMAPQVRIFPLQDNDGNTSKHLKSIMNYARIAGASCEVRRVDYEFQSGANEMLVLAKR